jgi:predicted ABC-type transport system involved in lysophospholipase L1 biosynthesis ATPase subunit
MQRPRIVLADEPTGNLDPATGEGVQELLFELNREHGCTLVVATHNDRLAAAMDRTVRLLGAGIAPVAAVAVARRGGVGC